MDGSRTTKGELANQGYSSSQQGCCHQQAVCSLPLRLPIGRHTSALAHTLEFGSYTQVF